MTDEQTPPAGDATPLTNARTSAGAIGAKLTSHSIRPVWPR